MNKEELYKLALSNVHKYTLLNEIFAIRDERFSKEQQDSMLCVNGYIGIDTLNDYVNLIEQLQQKENIIKKVREILLIYGETFDNKIHQEMQNKCLKILGSEIDE